MLDNFNIVNVTEEFPELEDIDVLQKYFDKNKWSLIKNNEKEDKCDYYQIYFGNNVQVDNNYEYGFPFSYNREDTKRDLERLLHNIKERKGKNLIDIYKQEHECKEMER